MDQCLLFGNSICIGEISISMALADRGTTDDF